MTEAKNKSWIVWLVIAVVALPVLAIIGLILIGGLMGALTYQRLGSAREERGRIQAQAESQEQDLREVEEANMEARHAMEEASRAREEAARAVDSPAPPASPAAADDPLVGLDGL